MATTNHKRDMGKSEAFLEHADDPGRERSGFPLRTLPDPGRPRARLVGPFRPRPCGCACFPWELKRRAAVSRGDAYARIAAVKRLSRLLMLLLLLAALPLRGYAGELMAQCEAHHGGVATVQEHVHEHGGSHHDDSGDGSAAPAASVCSICASCCAGASLAPDANALVAFPVLGIDRISFFGRRASGFVPEHFDRPPLVS